LEHFACFRLTPFGKAPSRSLQDQLAKWGKTQRLFNKKSADLEALNEIKATKAKGVQSKGENLLVPSVLAPPPDPSPGVHSCLSLSLSLSLLLSSCTFFSLLSSSSCLCHGVSSCESLDIPIDEFAGASQTIPLHSHPQERGDVCGPCGRARGEWGR